MSNNLAVHFSSETGEWSTPQELFDLLNKEFNFELDVCATKENRKCKLFFDEKKNGLTKSWAGQRCFMNPPYGREIGQWVEKAYRGGADIVVALLPSRTDTKWFHEFIYKKKNVEVRFLKGRLKFGTSTNSAPFPSMVVIFK